MFEIQSFFKIIFFSFFSLLNRRYSPYSLFEDALGNASHNMIIIIADSNIFLKCMLKEKAYSNAQPLFSGHVCLHHIKEKLLLHSIKIALSLKPV